MISFRILLLLILQGYALMHEQSSFEQRDTDIIDSF